MGGVGVVGAVVSLGVPPLTMVVGPVVEAPVVTVEDGPEVVVSGGPVEVTSDVTFVPVVEGTGVVTKAIDNKITKKFKRTGQKLWTIPFTHIRYETIVELLCSTDDVSTTCNNSIMTMKFFVTYACKTVQTN